MQLKIGSNESNQRIDRFLRKLYKSHSEIKLSMIYSWLRKGLIKVNGKKAKENMMVNEGDTIEFKETLQHEALPAGQAGATAFKPTTVFQTKDDKKNALAPSMLKKLIVYEDDNRIFWNKPAGIVAHPGNKHINDLTFNEYLEAYTKDTNTSPTFKPAFGFRLDKDTSGVLVAAKNYQALQYLNEIIRKRETDKTYLCMVMGRFPDKITIDKPLSRGYNKQFGKAQTKIDEHDGVEAVTVGENILTFEHSQLGEISFVKVKILTGRMHQIRVHLADARFPLLGDLMYGLPRINRILSKKLHIIRQLLHSFQYGFEDPYSGKKIVVNAPLPQDFITLLPEHYEYGEYLKSGLSGNKGGR